MKILLHGLNFTPEELGVGKYSGEMIRELAMAGHQCTVVTAPPYYPHWKVWDGYQSKWYRTETLGRDAENASSSPRRHFEVIRCPLWVPKRVTGLKRVLHLASFGLSSVPAVFWKAARLRPDVIITVEPTAFCMPTTWLAARVTGAKAWLHIQDYEVDAAFDLGILKSKWLRRAILFAESFLMRRFDRVSTISPNMVKKLGEKGVVDKRATLFPNWVDCNEMRPLWHAPGEMKGTDEESQPNNRPIEQLAARRSFGIPENAFVALYAGTIGDKQGLEILVEAARRLQNKEDCPVQIVVCGNGSGHSRLLKLSKGLANLQILPVQPFEAFNELMNCADVHLLPQKAGAADLVMPSKLTGMLATGRPVVACASVGTQIESVVKQCGIVVPPGEAPPFTEAILALSADPARCQRLGDAARDYAVNNLSREVILKKFEQQLQTLVGEAFSGDVVGHSGHLEDQQLVRPEGTPVNRPHFDTPGIKAPVFGSEKR